MLYKLQGNCALEELNEMKVSDGVRCAVFCDEAVVCLGFKREYQLIHTGER